MDIKDLMPQKLESPILPVNSECKKSIHKLIQDTVLTTINAYLKIVSDFQKDQIKRFMCSKTLLEAEEAIEKQYQLALLGDQKAAQNVASGMQYWKKLVLREINKYLEAA